MFSQTLAFSNPRLLSSFVSTAFEDILSGLPTSEQPYLHKLRRGPSRARVSRSSRFSAPHRSDRSVEPVRPVRQGFAGSDRSDDLPRVLAHSSVLARFYVNSRLMQELDLVSLHQNSTTKVQLQWQILLLRAAGSKKADKPSLTYLCAH